MADAAILLRSSAFTGAASSNLALSATEKWASPAYASSPENCHTCGCREFESHLLRHFCTDA